MSIEDILQLFLRINLPNQHSFAMRRCRIEEKKVHLISADKDCSQSNHV